MREALRIEKAYRWLLALLLLCAFALLLLHLQNLVASWPQLGHDPPAPTPEEPHPADPEGPARIAGAWAVVGLGATVPAFVFGFLAWRHPSLCRGASLATVAAAGAAALVEATFPRQPLVGAALIAASAVCAVALCGTGIAVRRKRNGG
jgi:hypothetical protein